MMPAVSRRTLLALIGSALVAGAPAHLSGQAPKDIAVVVHQDVSVENLTRAELRRVLLGDREFWPSGVRVTLLIRAPIARERDAVVKQVCDMTEAQFRQHWIAKVFRAETPSGPKFVYSREMAIDQVSRTPGAVALVETPLSDARVKVLKINGKLPGQAGYVIR